MIIRNASHKNKIELKQIITDTKCGGVYLGYVNGILNNKLRYSNAPDMPIFSIDDVPSSDKTLLIRCLDYEKLIENYPCLLNNISYLATLTPHLIIEADSPKLQYQLNKINISYAFKINSSTNSNYLITNPYELPNIKYLEIIKTHKLILEPPIDLTNKQKELLIKLLNQETDNLSIITGKPSKIRKLIKK